MAYPEHLILFFKKHNLYNKEMFDYLSKNTTIIDYEYEEQRIFIGCFYTFDKNGILKSIHLVLPYQYDEITTLICIHELIHGIELYKKLNKKAKITNDCEVLPILYEKIYVEEIKTKKIYEYQQYLDNLISKDSEKYYIALSIRDELYKEYNYDMKKIKKKSIKLIKKHKKQTQL